MQLILGAVNVVMTFPGLYIVERLGRRSPMIFGALWQAAWLLIFASIGVARPPTEYTSSGIVMIVSACMFIASFAMTWGPFAWVVIGETFPLRTRAKQASLATAGNWLGKFFMSWVEQVLTSGQATSSSASSRPLPTTASATRLASSSAGATLRRLSSSTCSCTRPSCFLLRA